MALHGKGAQIPQALRAWHTMSWGHGPHGDDLLHMFFPTALRRVLPENPLSTDTSTLTLTH